MVDHIREFLNSMSGNVTRSSCLAPLQWCIGICLFGIALAVNAKAPNWLLIVLSVFTGFTVVAYVFLSIYFGLNQPDNLRSERYTIRKMEIERGMVGDNLKGLEADGETITTTTPPPRLIEGGASDE